MRAFAVILVLLTLSPIAKAERKIYSCKDANGNAVFSPEPCGKDAKEVPYDAGQRAAPAGQQGAISAPTPGKPSDAIQDIADSVADSDCRRRAQQNAVYPTDVQIRELERRKSNIEQQGTYARNNLAGAQYLTGIREQLGQMDVAIAQERTRISAEAGRVDAQYRAELRDCDDKREKREAARQADR